MPKQLNYVDENGLLQWNAVSMVPMNELVKKYFMNRHDDGI
jgi:hypothetical protein